MANILLIDDELSLLETLKIFLYDKGHKVHTAATGKEGLRLYFAHHPDLVILDIRLPDIGGLEVLSQIRESPGSAKVIMITAFQDMETAIQAMKNGAYDYIRKPLDVDEIEKAVDRSLQLLEIEKEIPLMDEAKKVSNDEAIIGKSIKILEVFKKIGLLCQSRVPVLIQGETGTGKGLTARMIHQNSPYSNQPFVTMDCSAVVETLIENELFGHEKGAFTGADRSHIGKIQMAAKGTLFIDEIGELSLNLQKKFLGFLQSHDYTKVGGNQLLHSNCRIITATNRDLSEMVTAGEFREDLYYRLKVVTLELPALRERLSDIPLLAGYFLSRINFNFGTEVWQLQQGVLDLLREYSWPGNVREFENVLAEAITQARGKVILTKDLEKLLGFSNKSDQNQISAYSLSTVEKDHIKNILAEVGWKRTVAAQQLGISLPTLRSKIKKYGIIPPGDFE